MSRKIRLQKKYCQDKKLPYLVPEDGVCKNCKRFIWHMIRDNEAATECVTKCPFCNCGLTNYRQIIKNIFDNSNDSKNIIAINTIKDNINQLTESWELSIIESYGLASWLLLENLEVDYDVI